MISSINSSYANTNVHQSSPATAQKAEPQPQPAKGGSLSDDQVTLKSTGTNNK